jgi:hypothetical protein
MSDAASRQRGLEIGSAMQSLASGCDFLSLKSFPADRREELDLDLSFWPPRFLN